MVNVLGKSRESAVVVVVQKLAVEPLEGNASGDCKTYLDVSQLQ
jgi:hypothetical protein